MVTEKEVEGIAKLADIAIPKEELGEFTSQFNAILEYFDLLDTVMAEGDEASDLYNVFREDEVQASLPQDDVLNNPAATEDGFIRAPRVM
jgi:aspartyl-tRNA(Asn)/glutamyl-tRNA(Gln) amidotransferase subunit C